MEKLEKETILLFQNKWPCMEYDMIRVRVLLIVLTIFREFYEYLIYLNEYLIYLFE